MSVRTYLFSRVIKILLGNSATTPPQILRRNLSLSADFSLLLAVPNYQFHHETSVQGQNVRVECQNGQKFESFAAHRDTESVTHEVLWELAGVGLQQQSHDTQINLLVDAIL